MMRMTNTSGQLSAAERSDTDLASAIAAGETAAFETLMRRHNATMFRTARAILRDDAEAEDAVQDAYLRAYGAIDSFRGEAQLSTWLARIAANEALMRLRKRARRAAIVPLHASDSADEILDIADSDMDNTPDVSAQRTQLRRLLEAEIDALPDDYRVVFVLRAVEEMSVEEAAVVLGIAQATVRSRLFRARSLLREGLAAKIDVACADAFSFAGERCDRIVANVMGRIK